MKRIIFFVYRYWFILISTIGITLGGIVVDITPSRWGMVAGVTGICIFFLLALPIRVVLLNIIQNKSCPTTELTPGIYTVCCPPVPRVEDETRGYFLVQHWVTGKKKIIEEVVCGPPRGLYYGRRTFKISHNGNIT